jgi:precorrin-2 dehydrogenase/sirohydrochlorin ferrochelatase
MLDVTNRLVVIVGGGAVGVRKATGLLAARATRVRVVSLIFHAEMPDGVELVAAAYEPAHLDGAALVFAATDSPEMNAAIVRDARARGILVNRADADEADDSDFATPAVHRDGAVTITVSAAGSPAVAAKIRDEIKEDLDTRWIVLAEAMRTLRPAILSADFSPEARRELFRGLATEEAADVAVRDGEEGLRAWIELRIGRKLKP